MGWNEPAASGAAEEPAGWPTWPGGWIVLRQGDVPAAWHGRALRFALVPLGADEVRAVLGEAPPLSGLDDVDATLLRRAVAGDTVAAMARHVQMSTRSVQRRLAALRESFGVGSTAELAATVARQGFSPWHKDDG